MKIKVRSKDGTSSHIDVDAQDSVLSVRQRLVRSLGDSPAQVEAVQRWLQAEARERRKRPLPSKR